MLQMNAPLNTFIRKVKGVLGERCRINHGFSSFI